MATRRPLVAGNWKMHKTVEQAVEIVSELAPAVGGLNGVDVLVCPPYIALPAVAEQLEGTKVEVGAQNVHWEDDGAYTGEISPPMLKGYCSYAIVGHSERRAHFGETDETVNKRLRACLNHGLTPIMCVGETLAENEAGRTADVVSRQVRAGLQGVSAEQARSLVVAYEPIWAIGTGKAATASGANDVIGVIIRPALEHLFGSDIAQSVRVLYGGSIKPDNAGEFFSTSDIDGGLVGGASLEVDSFAAIATAAA